MSEEILHIVSSQIIDVVVSQATLTVYFLGGTSTEEMEGGGVKPDMYDIELWFADEEATYKVRSVLVKWYSNSDPVTVICYEDGSIKLVNEYSDSVLKVSNPSGN